MKSPPIRVLIADGDPLVCRALARLLRNNVYVKVIATSADRDEVLELAGRLHPAVALVDAHMARLDGMKVTQGLCQQNPATRVIILSVYEALRSEALSAGACRFLLKDGSRDALLEAIRQAASGQCEGDLGERVRTTRSVAERVFAANQKEGNSMPGLNTNDHNDFRVATGKLKDGWTYDVKRIPKTDSLCATVLHPCGNAASGGVPWSIEDPNNEVAPTYPTIEDAIVAARAYVDILSELPGYPDPDQMSARGFHPTLG